MLEWESIRNFQIGLCRLGRQNPERMKSLDKPLQVVIVSFLGLKENDWPKVFVLLPLKLYRHLCVITKGQTR